MTDRASAASDQDRLAFHVAIREKRLVSGHRRNTEAGAGGEVDAVGQRRDLRLRQAAVLGASAERPAPLRVPDPHPFPQ